ncbi:MAG TPA: hypothetical protein VFF11_07255 [Candidatus Binatia bacterium]|nr:hypothetical protein [Candidatus Binatia bacterium]
MIHEPWNCFCLATGRRTENLFGRLIIHGKSFNDESVCDRRVRIGLHWPNCLRANEIQPSEVAAVTNANSLTDSAADGIGAREFQTVSPCSILFQPAKADRLAASDTCADEQRADSTEINADALADTANRRGAGSAARAGDIRPKSYDCAQSTADDSDAGASSSTTNTATGPAAGHSSLS